MADQDKPEIDFDFSGWKRETDNRPFTMNLGGKVVRAIDPLELDVEEFERLMNRASAREQVEALFPHGEDAKKIMATKPSAAKVQELSRRISKHYGLDPTAA